MAPLDRATIERALRDDAHGGECYFFGVVRKTNAGRRVIAVSYDVHTQLCRTRFSEIIAAARAEHGSALSVALVHRHGRVPVGEDSVAVGVTSRHRGECFAACRAIIEAVKHSCPIWKQEHYEDGDSEWVEGHSLCR